MESCVHPSAVVAHGAELGDGVCVGPFCTVGANVRLGAGVRLVSHVVVDGDTSLAAGCVVFPFASIGTQTQDLKFRGARTRVEIGEETTLREYVTVNAGTAEGEVTRVGARCHIMAYAHIAHACHVGDDVIMANGATLAGEVEVGDQAVLGGLSMVHQFCRIGRLCMVGAGTKLVKDVPPYMLVDGNPARVRGVNIVGCRRRGIGADVRALLVRAFKTLYRDSLARHQAARRLKSLAYGSAEIELLLAFIRTTQRGIL